MHDSENFKRIEENSKRELKKIWDMPVKVIPVVVGALGMTPKKLKQQLSDTGIKTRNSTRILQNVLEV